MTSDKDGSYPEIKRTITLGLGVKAARNLPITNQTTTIMPTTKPPGNQAQRKGDKKNEK